MFVNLVWDESGGERVPVIKYILRETVEKTGRGLIRFTLTIAEKRGVYYPYLSQVRSAIHFEGDCAKNGGGVSSQVVAS